MIHTHTYIFLKAYVERTYSNYSSHTHIIPNNKKPSRTEQLHFPKDIVGSQYPFRGTVNTTFGHM